MQKSKVSRKVKLVSFEENSLEWVPSLRESSEDDQDYSCSSLEIQSLTTALSLMSQLLVQKNMRTTDWKALQATVDDLGELAKSHKDINVRQMSDKLRLVIATHGAVLRETEELKSRTEKVNPQPQARIYHTARWTGSSFNPGRIKKSYFFID